jgi:hypothetical protein
MPTLNWIGKDAVVNHHKEVPFRLLKCTDRFYPDFVCELIDGRFLVVEYKGFDRWSDEQCLVMMQKVPDWNAILTKLG